MRVVHELGVRKKNPGVNVLKNWLVHLPPSQNWVVELGPEEQR